MDKIELSLEDIRVVDKYSKITPLCDGILFALTDEYRNIASGHIIDANGREIVSGIFKDVKSTDGDEFVVSFMSHKYVVIDRDKKQILPWVYKDIILIGNGLYGVTDDYNNFFILNKKGKLVYDYSTFKTARSLGIGLTVCTLKNGAGVIYENGNEIARIGNDSIDNIPGCKDAYSYKPDKYEEKYIIIDKYGKQIVPGTYQKIISSDGNYFSVLTLEDSSHPMVKEYKLINGDGIETMLDDDKRKVVPLGKDLYAVGSLYDYKVIDKDKNQVFPDKYVDVKPLDGSLFALRTDHFLEYFELFKKKGEQVVPREYKSINYLGSGLYGLRNTLKTIVIDENGNRAPGFYYYSQRICFNGDYETVDANSLEELREKICMELKRIKSTVDEFSLKLDGIIAQKEKDNDFLIKNDELVPGMEVVRRLKKN